MDENKIREEDKAFFDLMHKEGKKMWEKWYKKYFDTRAKLNSDIAEYLKRNPEFVSIIEKTRKKYNIPKLSIIDDQDYPLYCTAGDCFFGSCWLNETKKRKQHFEIDIDEILNKFSLMRDFRTWVKLWVLYNEPDLTNDHLYNFGLYGQVAFDKNYRLTSQEKRYLKMISKDTLPLSELPARETKSIHKETCKIIDNWPKNKKRKMRSFETAIKTLELGKEFTETDQATRKEIVKIKKYDDIATEIDENYEFFGKEKLLAQRLRQQNHRLKQRMAPLPKNEN